MQVFGPPPLPATLKVILKAGRAGGEDLRLQDLLGMSCYAGCALSEGDWPWSYTPPTLHSSSQL